jgi:hypothetical protein
MKKEKMRRHGTHTYSYTYLGYTIQRVREGGWVIRGDDDYHIWAAASTLADMRRLIDRKYTAWKALK